jgi:hypothetical protein
MKYSNILLLKALIVCMSLFFSADSFAAAAGREKLHVELNIDRLLVAVGATPEQKQKVPHMWTTVEQFIENLSERPLSTHNNKVLKEMHSHIATMISYLQQAISSGNYTKEDEKELNYNLSILERVHKDITKELADFAQGLEEVKGRLLFE